jgi:hypothetical protein
MIGFLKKNNFKGICIQTENGYDHYIIYTLRQMPLVSRYNALSANFYSAVSNWIVLYCTFNFNFINCHTKASCRLNYLHDNVLKFLVQTIILGSTWIFYYRLFYQVRCNLRKLLQINNKKNSQSAQLHLDGLI